MSRRSLAVWVLLGATPAMAEDYSGLLSAGYDSAKAAGATTSDYGISGSAIGSSGLWNLQMDAGYQRTDFTGARLKDTAVQGSLFWRDPRSFSLGASFRYDDLDTTAILGSKRLNSYGGFGELYLGSHLTVMAKAGAITGALSGSYFSVGPRLYLMRHIAIEPVYEYANLGGGRTSESAGAALEIFAASHFPASLALSYAHSETASVGSNQIGVDLTYRFGDTRDHVTWDRIGPARWTGGFGL